MNEIVKNTDLQLPMTAQELEADANLGGKVTMGDMSVPFLYILQGLSPQAMPDSPKYIQGATASMLYLSVIEKAYPGKTGGLEVVPCYFENLFTEWKDRDKAGGGFVGLHSPDDPLVRNSKFDEKTGKTWVSENNILVQTHYHFVMVKRPDTDTWIQAIFPLKSTHLKASRAWNSHIATTYIPGTNNPAPRFLFKYRVTTVPEQKDTKIWSVPKITQEEMVNRSVYQAAKEFAKMAATVGLPRQAMEAQASNDDDIVGNEKGGI